MNVQYLWKTHFSFEKTTFFSIISGMSAFKTKKLPSSTPSPLSKDIEISSLSSEKKWMSKIIIGIIITIASLLFIGVLAWNFLFRSISSGNSDEPGIFTPIISSEFANQKKEGTMNILIAGIGGKWHEWGELTDSIMIASLNQKEKKIHLLSIPRDLYVAYGTGQWAGKINALYSLGRSHGEGINRLATKISEITGQPIDHYVVIDFSGFQQIIDILGGVEVNVEQDIIDPEYPTENWGYMTLVIRKGLQTFDGDMALKFARSRHSTSDFSRSERQKLLIKAMKEKALSTGYLTNPGKLSELYSAVVSHLDTDLSLATIGELAFSLRNIESSNIFVSSLSQDCSGIKKCIPGAFLYTPSRDLFGGASVVIPENARTNRLSYYDDIRRFVQIIFSFPTLSESLPQTTIITDKDQKRYGNQVGLALAKLGIPLSTKNPLITTTGSIERSHINIYWNESLTVGISPEWNLVKALKQIEEAIPYNIVSRNEYVTDDGPKVEIVLGKDAADYFRFSKPAYYIPTPIAPAVSGEKTSTSWTNRGSSGTKIPTVRTTTGSARTPIKTTTTPTIPTETTISSTPANSTEIKVAPGEWEDFSQ